jgi:ABC-type branched-subunit amino acid transport system substrate-binding protein
MAVAEVNKAGGINGRQVQLSWRTKKILPRPRSARCKNSSTWTKS